MVNAAMESVKALEPDPTGRFIPYVVRDTTGAGIHVEPLAAHDKEGDGDYDLVPQKTLKPAIAQGETL
jgi:methyl-accepting chemotaxis protein